MSTHEKYLPADERCAVTIDAAVTLFIGTIQGLVMQSLLTGDVTRIRQHAPRVFAIYQRGIGSVQ